MTIRSVLFVALSAAALACGSSSPEPDTTPPVKVAKVDVAIASVTLADDCGGGPTTAPAEPAEKLAQADAESMQKPGPGARMMSETMGDRACEQSSIQLRIANDTKTGSKVAIQKIELLDESGTKVADLTPRAPSRWASDSYQTWDEQIAPADVLQVSYALSAPNVAAGATYTVRVTIAAGDEERTLEQKTTLEAEATLPPGVVT